MNKGIFRLVLHKAASAKIGGPVGESFYRKNCRKIGFYFQVFYRGNEPRGHPPEMVAWTIKSKGQENFSYFCFERRHRPKSSALYGGPSP